MSCFTEIMTSSEILDKDKKAMFDMYVNSYTNAGQTLWFKSSTDMFKYPCGYLTHCTKNEYNNSDIQCFIMYQSRRFCNKISLLCHNNTDEGKTNVIGLCLSLLGQPGWVLEASGAVSWLLRKKHAPIITNPTLIDQILTIDHSKERIVMNDDFDYNNKLSSQYTHQYLVEGIVKFSNQETLFGTSGCEYDTQHCNRTCKKHIK